MYKLTLTGHCGEKTLLECEDAVVMANFLFNKTYYKQGVVMDAYIDLHTPMGSLCGSALDHWIETQIPQRVEKLIDYQVFQGTFLGKLLLKLHFIDDWYLDYLKHSTDDKYR